MAVKCSACGYANHNPDARACELCHAKLKAGGGDGGSGSGSAVEAKVAAKAKAAAELADSSDELAKVAVEVVDAPDLDEPKPRTKTRATPKPASATTPAVVAGPPAPPTKAEQAAQARRRSVVDALLFLLALPVSFPAALVVVARKLDWVSVPATVWVGQALLALAAALGVTLTSGADGPAWLGLLLPIAALSSFAGSVLLIRMRDGAAGWAGVAVTLGGACLYGGSLLAALNGGALEGHAGRVRAVDVTADGKSLASVGDDGTLRSWDLESGVARRTLRAHPGGATAVRIEGRSGQVFTGGADGTVCVWDVQGSDRPLVRLPVHASAVTDLDLFRGADGEVRLLTGSVDGSAKVWNVSDGTEEATLTVHTGAVLGVAWSPDGTAAAACGVDGVVAIWTLATGAARLLEEHEGPALCLAWSSDGKRLITGGQDRSICLWDVAGDASAEPRVLQGPGPVRAIAFLSDGARFVTAHESRLLQVWSVAQGVPVGQQVELRDAPEAIAVVPDGETLLVAGGRVVRVVPLSDLVTSP